MSYYDPRDTAAERLAEEQLEERRRKAARRRGNIIALAIIIAFLFWMYATGRWDGQLIGLFS